jgi:hypothetical protein
MTHEPYAYTGDNPLNKADRTGLTSEAELPEGLPCSWPCTPPAVNQGLEEAAQGAEQGIESGWNAITENEEPGDEGEQELREKEAQRKQCGNPAEPPGPGWEWKGKGEPGSEEGSWFDRETREYLRPDFKPSSHGPHYDYRGADGTEYRIYPDGRIEPKIKE